MTDPAPVRVVVVDDHAMFRSGVRSELTTAGAGVVDVVAEAADVDEAVAAIAAHSPDVVLLDVHLPGLDGLQVLESIRARWPKLPVIVMTAFGGAELADRILRNGATAFLDKPFHMSELMTVLERATEQGEAPWHGR